MDNNTNASTASNKQAYLDSIAVKTKAPRGAGISIPPIAIKLIAVGVVLLIVMVAVAAILNQGSSKLNQSYDKLSMVVEQLSSTSSPLHKYKKKIKSSELRVQTTILLTNLQGLKVKLDSALPSSGSPSEKATTEISNQITTMIGKFDEGYYAGHFDINFANAVALELNNIILIETEVRNKTDDKTIAGIIDESKPQLEELQTKFLDLANKL